MADPTRRSNPLAVAMGVLAALAVIVTGFLGYVGWFGGPLYRLAPATAAPPPALAGTVAIYLSGDAGFNMGMTATVAPAIAARGVPVVEVNSLVYFRHRRTAQEAAALVEAAARRALALPGARRVVLIGQSFGADMLQASAARLPASLRARVPLIALVVPGDTLLFKASPGGLLDGAPDGPALPSARRIGWVPVLCVHGMREDVSLCPSWRQRNVRAVALPGDHYLNHDTAALTQVLWRAIADTAGRAK
ncbi:AcvB/VirJ family lysyl-phosphatidylglycerol hydrolase [uncultured Sphingomonas sp.]|uniref:AcvB/VirJ family lysyl-phosphatidylglycerol hydrolase n=1 Tax=uncultured Sphingomonas sp. TaxID=158754 RepID=UPI0025833694|nr:AcvB/VirJ family lysyl-phosphatidylglycerol hydrolase [uncultured Sphingomonas sp.]